MSLITAITSSANPCHVRFDNNNRRTKIDSSAAIPGGKGRLVARHGHEV
jgi:hypothetical protein